VPKTVRVYWKDLRGRSRLNFNWSEIHPDSVVVVTASEYSADANAPKLSPRFIGDADVTVENISPHGPPSDPNYGVTFIVNVAWPTPLDIVTDITVMDDVPAIVQVQ